MFFILFYFANLTFLAQDNPDPNLFTTEVRNCAGTTISLGIFSAKVRSHYVSLTAAAAALWVCVLLLSFGRLNTWSRMKCVIFHGRFCFYATGQFPKSIFFGPKNVPSTRQPGCHG